MSSEHQNPYPGFFGKSIAHPVILPPFMPPPSPTSFESQVSPMPSFKQANYLSAIADFNSPPVELKKSSSSAYTPEIMPTGKDLVSLLPEKTAGTLVAQPPIWGPPSAFEPFYLTTIPSSLMPSSEQMVSVPSLNGGGWPIQSVSQGVSCLPPLTPVPPLTSLPPLTLLTPMTPLTPKSPLESPFWMDRIPNSHSSDWHEYRPYEPSLPSKHPATPLSSTTPQGDSRLESIAQMVKMIRTSCNEEEAWRTCGDFIASSLWIQSRHHRGIISQIQKPANTFIDGRFHCDLCKPSAVGFKTNQELCRHLVVHLETKSFKCMFCGKSYSRIDSVRNHLIRCWFLERQLTFEFGESLWNVFKQNVLYINRYQSFKARKRLRPKNPKGLN